MIKITVIYYNGYIFSGEKSFHPTISKTKSKYGVCNGEIEVLFNKDTYKFQNYTIKNLDNKLNVSLEEIEKEAKEFIIHYFGN